MKTLFRNAGLLAGAAFVLTAAGSAFAGDPPAKDKDVKVERRVIIQRAGPDGHMGGPMGHGGPMMGRRHDPEAHAQHMRDMLQLRPDQEPALKAFLEATKPEAHRVEKKLEDGEAPAKPKLLTTPERLDRQAEMMAKHQAAFQKRAAATRAFYAALSPSQQKVFDTLHARHHGGPRARVLRMGGPGGPMGGHGGPMRLELKKDGAEGGGGMAMLEGGDEDFEVFVSLDDDTAIEDDE